MAYVICVCGCGHGRLMGTGSINTYFYTFVEEPWGLSDIKTISNPLERLYSPSRMRVHIQTCARTGHGCLCSLGGDAAGDAFQSFATDIGLS